MEVVPEQAPVPEQAAVPAAQPQPQDAESPQRDNAETTAADATEQAAEWNDDDWLAEMALKLFPAPQYVDVVLVGDRSGSMSQYQGSSQAGTRDFIEKHRDNAIRSAEDVTLNGVTTHLTVVAFDTNTERPYSGDAQTVTPEDIDRCSNAMQPRGATRLFDTAIEEIQAQAERMREKESEGYAVHAVFSLLTDGADNQSRATRHELREAIIDAEARGVTCMFVQAGRGDGVRIGQEYGFAGARTLEMGHDPEHARSSMRAVTDHSTAFVSEAAMSASPSTHTPAAEPYDAGYRRREPIVMRSVTTPSAPAFTQAERCESSPCYFPEDYVSPAYTEPAGANNYTPFDVSRASQTPNGFSSRFH